MTSDNQSRFCSIHRQGAERIGGIRSRKGFEIILDLIALLEVKLTRD